MTIAQKIIAKKFLTALIIKNLNISNQKEN